MADGEKGAAGETGELTGKHLAFKLGHAFFGQWGATEGFMAWG